MSNLVPDIAITDKVVRSVAVCLFLLIAFRVAGKRQLGQLTAIGSDNSLGGGLVGASVIIARNWKEGITTLSEVRYAILEEDGHRSVIPRRPAPA